MLDRSCLCLTFCALLFASCETQNTQEIVVYSPHGKELLADFAQRFEAVHSGVKVKWQDMGSQDALDRVRSERANPQADLWWGGPAPSFMQAAEQNLLQAYRPSWAGATDSSFRDPLGRWYATWLTPEVIMFNTQTLTRAEAPQDWDEVLDEKWRGQIVLREPLASGSMRAIFFALVYRQIQASGSSAAGFAWLERLDRNIKSYAANPTLMYLALTRGEAKFTLWNLPDVLLQKHQYGYPFDYIVPRSGTPLVPEGIALVAGAKNLDLAKSFYEYVTSPESFQYAAQKYWRIPARRDLDFAQFSPETDPRNFPALAMSWQVYADSSEAWMKYWDAHIRNQSKP